MGIHCDLQNCLKPKINIF